MRKNYRRVISKKFLELELIRSGYLHKKEQKSSEIISTTVRTIASVPKFALINNNKEEGKLMEQEETLSAEMDTVSVDLRETEASSIF